MLMKGIYGPDALLRLFPQALALFSPHLRRMSCFPSQYCIHLAVFLLISVRRPGIRRADNQTAAPEDRLTPRSHLSCPGRPPASSRSKDRFYRLIDSGPSRWIPVTRKPNGKRRSCVGSAACCGFSSHSSSCSLLCCRNLTNHVHRASVSGYL